MRLSGALAAQFVILLATAGVAARAQTAPAASSANAPPAATAPNGGTSPASGDTSAQPQEPSADTPIHLHMPTAPVAQEQPPAPVLHHKKHVTAVRASAPEAAAAPVRAATTIPPAAPKAVQKPASASPPPRAAENASGIDALGNTVPFSFVPSSPPTPSGQFFQPTPNAHPPRMAKATPAPTQSVPPDVELNRGLVRQSQILFAPGAPNPSSDALDAIKSLAGPLNSALTTGASRIQVIAYGGNRGDRSSDARRLSLKRALAIRQLLIEGGAPPNQIDVRAMGGATDGAPADRVDVFTKD
jgi:outer membrane protein OmpA-like peptidoglycan-associated protein